MGERYRLIRLFTRGGMAEVYLGLAAGAEGFEKPVAIKRILPHLAKDERIARMFLSEAKLATFLNHQNIVQVFDVGRGPDGLFIVMELVNGWDLGTVIDQAVRQGSILPPPLAAFVASQALAGLCHAYKQSIDGKPIIIAHRDVSASNILISVEGEVKVADFGIARFQAPLNQTDPGTFKGKIAYSAPEVLQGQAASSASDQFAVGIILHEMLTGEHPFGRFENAMAYLEAIVHRPPAPLPGVPSLLSQTVAKALSKAPEDRFESPEGFARSLAKFLSSCGAPSTTHELADFLRRLKLPALPLAAGQDTVIRDRLPGSFSLNSMPSLGDMPHPVVDRERSAWQAEEIESLQKDWRPSGPELDASGEIRGALASKPPAAPRPRRAPSADGLRSLAEVQSIELARTPPQSQAPSSQNDDRDPAIDKSVAAVLAATRMYERRARRGGHLLKWLALGVLIGAGIWQAPAIYPLLSLPLRLPRPPPNATPILSIHSEPAGAKIQIGSQVLGETPLFIENQYPKTQIEVRLSLQGYHPWTGKFVGGETAELRARLRRR
jgi:serine/threonine-protein kinase